MDLEDVMDVQLDFLLQLEWKFSTGFLSNHLVCKWKSVLMKLVPNIIIPHLLLNGLQHLAKELLLQHCWYLQDGDYIWLLIVILISQYQRRIETRYQNTSQVFKNILYWTFGTLTGKIQFLLFFLKVTKTIFFSSVLW